jgi:hypothetical protein
MEIIMLDEEYMLQCKQDIQDGKVLVISRLETIISRLKDDPVDLQEWDKMAERLRKTITIMERITKVYEELAK